MCDRPRPITIAINEDYIIIIITTFSVGINGRCDRIVSGGTGIVAEISLWGLTSGKGRKVLFHKTGDPNGINSDHEIKM